MIRVPPTQLSGQDVYVGDTFLVCSQMGYTWYLKTGVDINKTQNDKSGPCLYALR